MHWWKRWPGRLRYELKALRRLGFSYKVDTAEWAANRLALEIIRPLEGTDHRLRAVYPADFPYVRVEVFAPNLALDLHQNPFTQSLCLLGRRASNWQPTYTLADLLQEQFPRVLKSATATDREVTGTLEEDQGEPLSDFYPYLDRSALMVDSGMQVPDHASQGALTVGLDPHLDGIRGVVLEIRDSDNAVLWNADEPLRSAYPEREIRGRWVKVDRPALTPEPMKLIEEAAAVSNKHLVAARFRKAAGGRQLDIIGIVFREEHARNVFGQGWIFVARVGREIRPRGFKDIVTENTYYVRAGRYGASDLAMRVPSITEFRKHSVVVVGVGSLGAPSAVELGKAGFGKLTLIDHDFVDSATTPRWSLGLRYAGWTKVAAVTDFLREHYPYLAVRPERYFVGGSREQPIKNLCAGADLIYDATADRGVERLTAEVARELGIHYVAVTATPGGIGGQVLHLSPQGPCFFCFMTALDKGIIPTPVAVEGGTIQPIGCADPTFVASNFDVGEVPLMGVRLAVRIFMARGKLAEAPAWNVATLSIDQSGGSALVPRWTTSTLEIDPACPNH